MSEKQLQEQLEEKVSADVDAEPRQFEDEYEGELDRIREEAQQFESGELPELGEETAEQFDTMLEAQKGELDMRRQNEKEDLLLRMFGAGAQRSTVAGEAAGRMLYGQEQTHRQLLADDANRRLNARADMADRIMNSLAFQAQVAQGQQQTALQAFGIEVQQQESAKDRASNMLDSLYGRRSNEKIAKIGANAQIKSAQIGASAQVKSAGIHAAATRYAASASAAAQRYSVDKNFKLGMKGMKMENRQFNKDLGFRQESLQYQDKWNQQDFGLREKELQYQDKWNKDAQRTQRRAQVLSFFGGLLSDVRLKDNVHVIEDAVGKVKQLGGFTWNWVGSPDLEDGGVIAQQVQQVMPEAVEETPEGFLVVKPMALVGLLMQAVHDLIEEKD
jgi:hypothetical protein